MNYGNTVTITPCVRFQSNRKPGLPVQQGLSDGNRIHKAQTGGRGSPRAVPSLRHPFLPHARNQNTCAGRSSSMQVHRANGLRVCERTRVVHRDLSRKPIPSTDRASCSHCLASGLARSAIGDVDRFPALDANAEITPCDPLDRLSGV